MRIGIATDHGGFELKEKLAARLRDAGHEMPNGSWKGVLLGLKPVGAGANAGCMGRKQSKRTSALISIVSIYCLVPPRRRAHQIILHASSKPSRGLRG
jgi:hypothetical protein